jgi:hypothetical protein
MQVIEGRLTKEKKESTSSGKKLIFSTGPGGSGSGRRRGSLSTSRRSNTQQGREKTGSRKKNERAGIDAIPKIRGSNRRPG